MEHLQSSVWGTQSRRWYLATSPPTLALKQALAWQAVSPEAADTAYGGSSCVCGVGLGAEQDHHLYPQQDAAQLMLLFEQLLYSSFSAADLPACK